MLLDAIARLLTRKPKLILIVAVILLIPSAIGYILTPINYDILSYLPEEMDSVQGIHLLEDPFGNAATSMLVVENMPSAYTSNLAREIEKVDGVTSALCLSSAIGPQFPQYMLPESVRKMFYSDNATMMIIRYENPAASKATMKALDEIRKICNKNCFLAGFSGIVKDTHDIMDGELFTFILVAVICALIAMALTINSWVLPLTYIISIFMAVVYNMGTNFILGEVSYVTKAIAAVLQLGVTMDYSIFLSDRYEEEKQKFSDKRDAMASSVKAAFVSLSGSSLTTVAGFLALCFMSLTLGLDIGLVMAKGVIFGVIVVIFVLPSILLVFDSLIEKTRHRCIRPNLTKPTKLIIRHPVIILVIFIALMIPFAYAHDHAPMYYKLDQSLPADTPSIVANEKLKADFNMGTSHFVVMADDLAPDKMTKMEEELENVQGVKTVLSYHRIVGPAIPDFFVPDSVKSMLKTDGLQMLMITSEYGVATDAVSTQLDELNTILKKYDSEAKLTGESAMTKDLITICAKDFKVTDYLSMLAIFIIVLVAFKSLTVPIVLVATIKLATFINQGIPYFTDHAVAFIAPTLIGCIQMGATVDYAILMTSRFKEELYKGKDRKEAIIDAAVASDVSIISSALVLFLATIGVSAVSSIELIGDVCMMIARGAFISCIVCVFMLPALLYLFEPIFNVTSLHWRKPKDPSKKHKRRNKKHKADEAEGAEGAENEANVPDPSLTVTEISSLYLQPL